jgi:ABC-type Mn2+/Zn2+ transport system permease subunit
MTPWSDYLDITRLLWPSLLASAATALGASSVGTFVLLRREPLAALALPHVVAVGAAVALRMAWPPLPAALASVAVAVAVLGFSRRRGSDHWVLPALYIAGLCVSFLIIANSGQHLIELQNLFTGIEVAVTPAQAAVAAPLLLLTGGACALLWRRWLAVAQVPAAAELARLHPARWDVAFLSLLAVVSILGTSTVGAVMVVAMLFLPAGAALPWARRLPGAVVGAAVVALASQAAGFVLSVEMQWPLSQSVGGAGFAALLASHAASRAADALRRVP